MLPSAFARCTGRSLRLLHPSSIQSSRGFSISLPLAMPIRFDAIPGGSFAFNDGNDIPKIGLGISRIVDQEKLTAAVRAALSAGYRLFDTARIYKNEDMLGVALRTAMAELGLKREDIFITTKVPTVNEDPAGGTEQSVRESLERLQTDYLDLVLVHYPRDRCTGQDDDERNGPIRKIVWQKLEEIKARGTIRSIGVSNYEVYHLAEMFEYAKVLPVLNQCEYHPYNTEKLLRRFCAKKGIVFQAFSSLCWGNQEILNEAPVKAAAEKYGVTAQTILYAFAVSTGVGIIPKSETPARIAANLHDTIKASLTPDEQTALLALNRGVVFCPGCAPGECI
ncbi:hypothetical protein PENTCL1PPCAC_24966 [Pristionchus entomophagus]|uniref:NADP-dependent oxidoreductase domain-containing protein n=1 Tax=Pristionchus entomophagus TaxID=358040 RepID=A0AAV5U8B5_9BILA|nr:hypothetical protein PENTCL1PPCAC_24966 [Pristionchus entomophagus]